MIFRIMIATDDPPSVIGIYTLFAEIATYRAVYI